MPKNRTVTIEFSRPEDYSSSETPRMLDVFYRVTITPGDPTTTCQIEKQAICWNEGCGVIVAWGIGVRKPGDLYDRETGCRMALASALRKVKDQTLRAKFWALYLEKFPVEKRMSQNELLEKKLFKTLLPLVELDVRFYNAAVKRLMTAESAARPIHRTWRFGEKDHSNGAAPKAERMEELKY